LDEASRRLAPRLVELLNSTASDELVTGQLTELGFDVDYIVTRDNRRFAAVRLGQGAEQIRLIDNVVLKQVTL